MSLPQPNKAASVLAALIGVCAVIGKRLLARRAAPAILYGFTAFLILLTLAYLACVFLIRDKRKNKAPVGRTASGKKTGRGFDGKNESRR